MTSCEKEKGVYMRYLLARLGSLRYQTRLGVKEAGGHGVPQGRFRALVWAARQGEQLPAFPAHSHTVRNFNTYRSVCRGFTRPIFLLVALKLPIVNLPLLLHIQASWSRLVVLLQ